MNIYIGHSKDLDYHNELYYPLRNSSLDDKHELVFPHEDSEGLFNSKKFLKEKCDLFIAETSYKATGTGIELGRADMYKVPIICVYKKGSKLSGSLKTVTNNFIEYENSEDLIKKIIKYINTKKS